jgi:hypothetical protein
MGIGSQIVATVDLINGQGRKVGYLSSLRQPAALSSMLLSTVNLQNNTLTRLRKRSSSKPTLDGWLCQNLGLSFMGDG